MAASSCMTDTHAILWMAMARCFGLYRNVQESAENQTIIFPAMHELQEC
jgi:hypothetical protein